MDVDDHVCPLRNEECENAYTELSGARLVLSCVERLLECLRTFIG